MREGEAASIGGAASHRVGAGAVHTTHTGEPPESSPSNDPDASSNALDPDDGATLGAEAALDPTARHVAFLAPPWLGASGAAVDPTTPAMAAGAVPFESVFAALVTKCAWSGDARRGTVRLELGGDGDLAGSVVVIHADGDAVRVAIASPRGVPSAAAWTDRITSRLAARGLRVESVEIG